MVGWHEPGLVISTDDMIHLLADGTQASYELGQTFLSSYVGIVRWTVVLRASTDSEFYRSIREDRGELRLNQDMALEEWSRFDLVHRISDEIGLFERDTYFLFDTFKSAIDRDIEQYAIVRFEPLGLLRREVHNAYLVQLGRDFLYPDILEEPPLPGDLREHSQS